MSAGHSAPPCRSAFREFTLHPFAGPLAECNLGPELAEPHTARPRGGATATEEVIYESSLFRRLGAVRRGRTGACRAGAAVSRPGHEQPAADREAKPGAGDGPAPAEVFRHQRRRQERLRRRRAFVRRPGDAGARSGVVRPSARWRLLEDPGRQPEGRLIARRRMSPRSTAARAERCPIPAQAGIGLRFPHHQAVADTRPATAWLEVHTKNYLGGAWRSTVSYAWRSPSCARAMSAGHSAPP